MAKIQNKTKGEGLPLHQRELNGLKHRFCLGGKGLIFFVVELTGFHLIQYMLITH